jgi:hypothetical protein
MRKEVKKSSFWNNFGKRVPARALTYVYSVTCDTNAARLSMNSNSFCRVVSGGSLMSPMVRNTDLMVAFIGFKTLILLLVAIYLLLTKIYPVFCRENNNNNSRQLFDPNVVLDFVVHNEDRGEVFYLER